ncbi:WXG100 family type VII secretion target [Micromonospora sp. NPDC050187]|uniref:WXG100 family type VII secretion target n=1 Tax=Micromonospora sp. NPDC050187 TaxID=3364277 RepID=UPI0037A0B288
MSDEYVQRYQPVSHEQLYQGVQAGDAEQIDTLATAWSSMKDTVDGLGRALREDLDALDRTWTGDAGDEFQRRVGLVVQYSTSLATGMGSVHEGLSLMSGPLRAAQRQAESPDETDDHDKTVSGAAKGALLGPVGAVIGGIAGHQQDQEEKEKAHQRMVKVVAELAASYDLSTFDRWSPPAPPPVDTPGGVDDTSNTPRSGPGATTPASAPGTGSPGHTGTSRADSSRPVGHADFDDRDPTRDPDSGLAAPTGPGSGTSLAGAGPSLGTGALLTGWAAGAGGMVASAAGGTRTSGAGTGPSWGSSTALPAGGVLGTAALAAGASGAGSAPMPRPAGGTGLESRAAVGGGGRLGAAGNRPGAVGSMRPGVLGGAPMSGGDDDESATRSTWLTEDDMDWHAGSGNTPPVLGLNGN